MFHLRALSQQPEFSSEKINKAPLPTPRRKTLPKTQRESKPNHPGKLIAQKGPVKLFWKTTAGGTARTLISKAVIIFDPQKIGTSIPWVNRDNIKQGKGKKTLVVFRKRDAGYSSAPRPSVQATRRSKAELQVLPVRILSSAALQVFRDESPRVSLGVTKNIPEDLS